MLSLLMAGVWCALRECGLAVDAAPASAGLRVDVLAASEQCDASPALLQLPGRKLREYNAVGDKQRRPLALRGQVILQREAYTHVPPRTDCSALLQVICQSRSEISLHPICAAPHDTLLPLRLLRHLCCSVGAERVQHIEQLLR